MIVVSDTSPLNYLIRLGHAEVLKDIYGRVHIPPAVAIEMQHPQAPSEVGAFASQFPRWLEVVKVRHIDTSLNAELGTGEREAISLAVQAHADVLLIDDRAGREEAQARNIPVAGTLAVLLQASLRGHFEFPDALESLRRFGFRVSRPVAATMLYRYEQNREKKP